MYTDQKTREGVHVGKTLSALKRPPAYKPLMLLFTVLTAFYAILIWLDGRQRILWYDELFTYYAAKASTLEQVLKVERHVDLNPPLSSVLTHFAIRLFGDRVFAVRAPSIIA